MTTRPDQAALTPRTFQLQRWRTLPRRLRDPRALRALAAVAAVAGGMGLIAWSLTSRSPRVARIPRGPQDFLTPAALETRLQGALEKLKSDPDDMEALLEAGKLQFEQGKEHYTDAINALELAWRLGAADPTVFYYLATMYQELGLTPFAVDHYHRFIRNFPEDREARLMLAKLLYKTGRFEDAVVQYQSLKQGRERPDPVIDENLGLSLLGLKRYEEAVRVLEPLAASPLIARRSHYFLGVAYHEMKNWEKAREHLAIVADPEKGDGLEGVDALSAHALMADNAEKLDVKEEALEHFEAVVRLDPKNSKAKSSASKHKSAIAKVRREAERKQKEEERKQKEAERAALKAQKNK